MSKPRDPEFVPQPIRDVPAIGSILGQVIALRGIGRVRGDRQLIEAWRKVAGLEISAGTRPTSIRHAVLHVVVTNSALLGELVGFHRATLLHQLRTEYPHLKVRDLKFRLQGRERLGTESPEQ